MTDDEPHYACLSCLDDPAGWRRMTCHGTQCGRRIGRAHPPHDYMVRCRCWLLRHQDAIRVAAQNAISKGRPIPDAARALQDLDAR